MKPTEDHKLFFCYEWQDEKADYRRWYELWTYCRNWRGKWAWRRKQNVFHTEAGKMEIPYTGDREWANKIAKHYKIELPEATV